MGRPVGDVPTPSGLFPQLIYDSPEFTFVLEQKKTYLVGRDRSCDIQIEGRYIRPKEGRLSIGDWDPTNVRHSSPRSPSTSSFFGILT
jgi:hypothetical protein